MVLRQGTERKDALERKEILRKQRWIRVLALFLAFIAVFAIGFGLRGNTALMQRLGFSTGLAPEDMNPGMTVSGNTYDSISARLAEVEGIIKNESLDSYDLDAATTGVMATMVELTNDPYFRYFDKDRYARYLEENPSGSYTGVGVLFAEYNGAIYAAEVFPGSEAEAEGVQQGDFAVALSGERIEDWTAAELTSTLAKAEGSSVVLTWQRRASMDATTGDEFTTVLTCMKSDQVNVENSLDGTVGYISVRQFTQDTASLVSDAIKAMEAEGAESYILDLRDCPGGYLTQAVDIASLFMKSGTIVQIKTKDATSSKIATGNAITDKPLIVLVNANTAGSAEVLTAALQDSERAKIVGATTMGKGSVQITRELSFGGALRFTAAHYISPLGHDIDGIGVTPNIIVSSSDSAYDIALDTARSLS